MASDVERRTGSRRSPPSIRRSESPVRDPRRRLRRSPPRKGQSAVASRSPRRQHSPAVRRYSSSNRGRSPGEERPAVRSRSPKRARPSSLSRSPPRRNGSARSPSPRAKRMHLGRAERELELARDSQSKSRRGEREPGRSSGGDDDGSSVAKMNATASALEAKEKEKPSFELSGKLAEETNRVRGITLLFNEPPEASKSDIRWRLYVFKAGEVLNEPLYIHRQSCYLFGRERKVADVPTDHPSCSKQHAVLQYRLVEKELPDGMMSKQVRPYLMDLGSTNGTFINDSRIEERRYYELFEKDTLRFGNSSREYVLLHENSTT